MRLGDKDREAFDSSRWTADDERDSVASGLLETGAEEGFSGFVPVSAGRAGVCDCVDWLWNFGEGFGLDAPTTRGRRMGSDSGVCA
ncbi:MAG TPA: hypothetical protein VK117_03595 [Pyrinomonadaceae bacterium]|nr:hypothetical protein [Pyrinomonadaceae bacterium]